MTARSKRIVRPQIDELTGLPTFAALPSALDAVAMLLDIDGFRYVNDEHGHLVGDEVLAALGAWLAERARALEGSAFRVAGEKFLLLLPRRSQDDAVAIANELVSSVSSLRAPVRITLSAVVFAADRDLSSRLRATLDELTNELYRAELASGRDRSNVVVRQRAES